MKLFEGMSKMYEERESFLDSWSFVKYAGRCKNCGRYRRYLCKNSMHLCDKCYWCEESNEYVNLD